MIDSPYPATASNWYRGNLHTHTTASDGTQPIRQVIDQYHRLGYDFLMISDHDIVTGEAEYAALETHGMTMIPGNEVTKAGRHILHVHADSLVPPDPDRQTVINQINQGRGFAILNHPTWWDGSGDEHASLEYIRTLDHYTGIEIYNGVIGRLSGNPESNYRWDNLLHDGQRIWGFANDDCHDIETKAVGISDAGLGWNMVCCDEPTVEQLVDAMRRGAFYASTGVTIDRIAVEGNAIQIEAGNADRIIAFKQIGQACAVVDDSKMTLEFPENADYIRFECYGSAGTKAWTQPFFRKSDG